MKSEFEITIADTTYRGEFTMYTLVQYCEAVGIDDIDKALASVFAIGADNNISATKTGNLAKLTAIALQDAGVQQVPAHKDLVNGLYTNTNAGKVLEALMQFLPRPAEPAEPNEATPPPGEETAQA